MKKEIKVKNWGEIRWNYTDKFDEIVLWVRRWFGTQGIKALKRAIKENEKSQKEITKSLEIKHSR